MGKKIKKFKIHLQHAKLKPTRVCFNKEPHQLLFLISPLEQATIYHTEKKNMTEMFRKTLHYFG